MAITTFDELKTAIGDWMDRSDLTSYLADFITLAEGHLNRNLRHRKMVTSTDITPTSNVYALPTDYLHYIRVVEKGSIRYALKYIEADAAEYLYPSSPAGIPVHFTIVGDNLKAYPLSSNDIELTYRQKLTALSDANTSNWLLAASPETYLRASQMMAMQFINETSTPRYQATALLLQKLINDLNEESNLGERYKAGVQLNGPTP